MPTIFKWTWNFALLLIVLAGASACGNNAVEAWRAPPVVETHTIVIPEEWLTCPPTTPTPGDGATQPDIATAYTQEKIGHIICWRNIGKIKALQDAEKAKH